MTPPTNQPNGVHDDQEVWYCKGCPINSKNSKKKINWIVCAGCEDKYESNCVKVKQNEYNFLDSRVDVLWLCSDCVEIMCPIRGLISDVIKKDPTQMQEPPNLVDVMSKLRIIQEKIGSLSDIQLKLKDTMDSLQNDVMEQLPTDLKQQMDDKMEEVEGKIGGKIEEFSKSLPVHEGKTWAEVLQAPPPPPNNNISIETLKKALVEINEIDKEKEVRSRGIVVYRAPETIREANDDEDEDDAQGDEDDTLIRDLLRFLECDVNQLQSTNRLGKFSAVNIREKKYRPIKVRFQTPEARDNVLSSLSKLRLAPQHLKNLSIRQDLNYMQRQELNNKIKEAKDRSIGLVDSVFRVRGNPGHYYLVEMKRNNGNFLAQARQ